MVSYDWWRIFVSTIGSFLLLFLLSMALKELYLEPATAPVRALLVALPWVLGFLIAWIVVTSGRIPWIGDGD